MDLEPLNPEPFDRGAEASDATAANSPAVRGRHGLALAGTIAGLALVGAGFLLGRNTGGSAATHNVNLADASAIQDASNPSNLCGPPTRRNFAAGQIDNVASDGKSFTLTTLRRGSLKVTTSNSTTFRKTTTGSVADATPGTHIRVHGTRGADGTIAADHLAIAPAPTTGGATTTGPARMGRGAGGVVKTNDNGTLTVTEPDGTVVKVTTASSTVVVKMVSASMSDVKPGLTVLAQGTQGADGSLNASHVVIVGSGVSGPFGFGGFGGAGGFPGRRFRGPDLRGVDDNGPAGVTPWDASAGATA